MNNQDEKLSIGFKLNDVGDSDLLCRCCHFKFDNLFLPPPLQEAGFHEINDEYLPKPMTSWRVITDHFCHLIHKNQVGKSTDETISLVAGGLSRCVVVDTHNHAHLMQKSQQISYDFQPAGDDENSFVSLTCAVEQSDWASCLEYASQSPLRLAAVGWHPWYVAELDETGAGWEDDLEQCLKQHPGLAVGEIGLCRSARFVRTHPAGKHAALALQRAIFTRQLLLAGRYSRPVTVHCVGQHSVLLDVLRESFSSKERHPLPPAIALHSFSGTAKQVQHLLQWEASILDAECVQPHDPPKPLLYFGFSHAVNYNSDASEKAKRQQRDAIRSIPHDRILAESDVHCHTQVALGTAGALQYLAWALDEPIEKVADFTRWNGLRFLKLISKTNTIVSDITVIGQQTD